MIGTILAVAAAIDLHDLVALQNDFCILPELLSARTKRSSGVETDITRDVGWQALREAGWRPVTQIAIDATWSALRFRPADQVGR